MGRVRPSDVQEDVLVARGCAIGRGILAITGRSRTTLGIGEIGGPSG